MATPKHRTRRSVSRKPGETLKVFHEIVKDISSQRDLGQLLESIAGKLARLVRARRSLFILVDNQSRVVIRARGYGYNAQHLENFSYDEFAAGLSGWVCENRETAHIPDAQHDSRQTGIALERAHELDSGALIVAPLMLDGQPGGTLTVVNRLGDPPFSQRDVELVEMFADHASIAIQNANAIEELRAIDRHRQLLLESSQETAAAADLDQALKNLSSRVVRSFLVSFCCILLLDESEHRLVLGAADCIQRADPLTWKPQIGQEQQLLSESELAGLFHHGKPVIYSRGLLGEGPFLDRLGASLGIEPPLSSAILAPLKSGERELGVYIIAELRGWERRPFEKNEIELASTLANQVAVMIEKIELLEQTRSMLSLAGQSNRLLYSLDEASRHIRVIEETPRLLYEIVRLAVELAGCRTGCFLMYHPGQHTLEVAAVYGAPIEKVGTRDTSQGSLAHRLLNSGLTQVVEKGMWPFGDSLLEGLGFTSFISVPLHSIELDALLVVGNPYGERSFSSQDTDVLERFAAQASIALQTSQLISREQRVYAQLSILKKISEYIQAAGDLDNILHVVLTGVTAGYGLGLNRAALLLYHPEKDLLAGKSGIGFHERAEAEADWKRHHTRGLEDFRRYIEALEHNELTPTPVGIRMRSLEITVGDDPVDAFGRVLHSGASLLLDRNDIETLPEDFHAAFEPDLPAVILPLKARERVIGLIVADNKFTHAPITQANIETLQVFANNAAAAIENARRFKEIQDEASELEYLRRISIEMSTQKEIDQVLSTLVEGGVQLLDVEMAVAHLMDETTGEYHSHYMPHELGGMFTPPRKNIGLTAQIIRSGAPVVIQDTRAQRDEVNPQVVKAGIRSLIGFPVRVRGNVMGAIFFNSRKPQHFGERALELTTLLVNQASNAIENARAYQRLDLNAHLTNALLEVSRALTEERDLMEQLEIVWHFVSKQLRAPMFYIGLHDEVEDQIEFLCAYDLGERIKVFRKSLEERSSWGVAGYVVKTGAAVQWHDEAEKEALLQQLGVRPHTVGATSLSNMSFPLVSAGRTVGVIAMQHAVPHAWNEIEQAAFQTLVRLVAVAIQSSLYLQEVQTSNKRLQTAYSASKEIASMLNPEQALQDVVERVCQVMDACRANIVLIDPSGRPVRLVCAGFEPIPALDDIIRSDGISQAVIASGEPRFIENVSREKVHLNPSMAAQGIQAAACLPLEYQGRNLGVLWIQFLSAYRFSESDRKALQLYANQAAIAYKKAHQLQELQHMRQAAVALSGAGSLQEVLKQIVGSARVVLNADSAAIWAYDPIRNEFSLPNSLASGIPDDIWELFREEEPKPGQTAYTVMEQRWISVEDINDQRRYEFVRPSTRALLGRIGARSFQGIALTAGDEYWGTLYVNYNHPHAFSDEERQTAITFASSATLALKKASLLDKITKARSSAQVVAKVTTLEDLRSTLQHVAQGAIDVLGCDVVAMFEYIPRTDRLRHPPILIGAAHPERAKKYKRVLKNSIVYTMLQRSTYYIAEDVPTDELFKTRRFSSEEGILSCFATPLIIGEERLGVMFLNFRHHHTFTEEEKSDIELFAHQAAVAIRNAQLYEESQQRAKSLEAITKAGQIITGTLELPEILNRIAEQAYLLTGEVGKYANFAAIMLVTENHTSRFAAAYPEGELEVIHGTLGAEIDLQRGVDGRIGVTGKAIKTGRAQLVTDVRRNKQYLISHLQTRSELAVPIIFGEKVIGVINVEHRELDVFDQDDQRNLESLAAHAAIAIEHARKYEDLKRIKGFVGSKTAEEWIKMVSDAWGHGIRRDAITGLGKVELMRQALDEEDYDDLSGELKKLELVLESIRDTPIIPPLSPEDSVGTVEINNLLSTYLKRKKEKEPQDLVDVCFDMQPGLDDRASVRASPEWLRRALEILVDNAYQAMVEADSQPKRLTCKTKLVGEQIEITICDTGPGIPERFLEKLFEEPVKSEKGAGLGLVLAGNIVRNYDGSIRLEKTDRDGTHITISLPIERLESPK